MRIISTNNIPVFDQDLMISTVADVTEKVNSTEKYKYLFQNNPAIMVAFDFESLQIIDCNNAALQKYGYTRAEFLLLNIKDTRPVEDIFLLDGIFADEETYFKFIENPIRHQKKNGDIFYVKVSSCIIDYEGRKCSLVQVIDVTEQLLAEENLKASEAKHKQLFELNPLPMMVWDFKTKNILDCNEEALYQYGYTREEFLNLNILDICPEEDIQLIKNATKDEQSYRFSPRNIWCHRKKSGELMYVNVTGHVIDFNGRKASLAMLVDMTKQIEAEEQKEFEKRDKEALINSTNDLIWSVSLDLKLIAANQSFHKHLDKRLGINLKPGESVISKDKFTKTALAFWETFYKEALLGNTIIKEIYTPKHKNHLERWAEVTFNPIYASDEIIGVACFSRNITEIKLAGLEIKKNQKILAEAQSLAKIGSWELDTKTEKFTWSQEMFKIFDIDETTFYQHNNGSFIQFIDPEYQNQALEVSNRIKETGENYEKEYGIKTAKGEKKVLYEMGYGEKSEDGEVIRFFGTVQDITERKLAEDQVKKGEIKYRSFFENSMDGILLTVPDGDVLVANPAACKIFQMTEKEIIKKGRLGLVDPKDPRLDQLQIERQNNGSARGELTLIRNDGTKFQGELASFIFKDSDNKERTSIIVRDITKKKKEEERLKLLESVIINTNDSVIITEVESFDKLRLKIIYVNEAFTKMTGYSAEEVIGKTPKILQGPLSDRKELKRLSAAMRNWESCAITTTNYKKNGEPFWVNFSVSPVADKTGWYTHWIAIVRDVTEQKNSEENLKNVLLEKNEILESIGDAFFAINHEWTITYWNRQAENMLSNHKKEIIGDYLWNVFPDHIDSDTYLKYHQAMSEQILIRFEHYFERLDKWYEISIYPSNTGLSVYLKDISERVTYTKAIEDRNIKLKEIAYTQSHIVRAPLARILGLVNLIDELKASTSEGKELLGYINQSAIELDNVIRDIVSKTEFI